MERTGVARIAVGVWPVLVPVAALVFERAKSKIGQSRGALVDTRALTQDGSSGEAGRGGLGEHEPGKHIASATIFD